MDEKPTINLFIGRTAGGFAKFLEEKNLEKIDSETFAKYVLDAIECYERRDRDAFHEVLFKVLDAVGVTDGDTAVEVSRQFSRVCDTYRAVFQIITGNENVLIDRKET